MTFAIRLQLRTRDKFFHYRYRIRNETKVEYLKMK